MSVLDSLKEQGKSIFEKITERIKESNSYAQAQDRYSSMSPFGQQLTRLGLGLLVAFIIAVYPMMTLLNSRNTLIVFEENRNLIRELFKTYRESTSSQNIPVPPDSVSLRASIESIIQRADLSPEQNLGVAEGSADGKLIPKNLVSNVMSISLAKLNLKQIVDIGANIVGISESIKMRDLALVANSQDTRYYDVTYTLYSLKVPEPMPEPPPEVEKKSSSKNKGNDSGGTDE